MAVYLDKERWVQGRGYVCHMMADTHRELVQMARKLGLWPNAMKHRGTAKEHYNVVGKRRQLAVGHYGAQDVTTRELVAVIRRKRAAMKERGEY
jgi:hypothetical protein